MKVFVTGASGYIGNAVAQAFSLSGHAVSGLIRSEQKAQLLRRAEIVPVIGDLVKPDSYRQAIKEAEVIVHCASDHSLQSDALDNSFIDNLLVETKGPSISQKTIIYTSGVWGVGNTGSQIVDEAVRRNPLESVKWRNRIEEKLLDLASSHLRTVIISPGCVYGGLGGLTSFWFSTAKDGSIEIVGSGENRWAMVHVADLAQAYVLAAEKEIDRGIFYIVDHTHYTVKEMALASVKATGVSDKVHNLLESEAAKKFGSGLASGLLIDQQISNERAARLLEWRPRHKGFIEDIDRYYETWKAFL